jgi:phosphatidylglycerophosphate synthase
MFEGLANLANAVTAARLIATPLFVLCAARADESFAAGWVAGLLFAVAAWSDVADGRMARHRGTASDRGRILDHFADIVFVIGVLVFNDSAGLHWLPAQVVDGLFLLVPVYSAASIAARFLGRAEPILKTAGGA